MPNCGQVGVSVAGGTILGPGAPTVLIEGFTCSTLGDEVESHGIGEHASATMVESSATVLAEGRGIVRLGDLASCGDAVANGAATVLIGD